MVTFFFVLMESEVSGCGVDGTLWELASALAVPGSNRTLGGLVGGTSGLLAGVPANLRERPGLRAGSLTEGKDGGVSVMGVEGGMMSMSFGGTSSEPLTRMSRSLRIDHRTS